MNMHVISDNTDTLTGFRLVGVSGVVVHTQEELTVALTNVINNKHIAVVLVAEQLAKQFPELIADAKINYPMPLLVEIPDRHGTNRPPDFISAYVREAVGVRV